MSLDLVHQRLSWPRPEEIRSPSGEGARIFAELAEAKIGRPISLLKDVQNLKIGVLAPNSQSDSTEPPLAIVAELGTLASDETLRELHRLSWNFSHTPMLITLESHLLRVWTCCEPPDKTRSLRDYLVPLDEDERDRVDVSNEATKVLHWTNLISGQFFRDRALRFRRDQRADQTLLANLRFVRELLRKENLDDDDVCHDLLARIIFVQFLFDRKDPNGKSALNEKRLARLRESNVLRHEHRDFAGILSDYDETYRLFDWLNARFNGDLFPGKGITIAEREAAWREEKRVVKPSHLRILHDFVKGDLDMPTGQLCLWPQYAFDAIPLEFISTIYEAFASERARHEGIYYTPPYLVDFMLDRVLCWNSDDWNLKILDPACGSGVFLVKAFQRLIHRWKKAHPHQDIRAETLRGLLENNLFGIDKDRHAVRVASFSLYLAMCDEIDPRHYWTQVQFPPMRGKRLVNEDFFDETTIGFRTYDDAAKYDLVIGNAPWGEKTLSEKAEKWAKVHDWPVANKVIAPIFLPKSAALTKFEGKIAMIQPATSLLFNRSGTASAFRQKFFNTFKIHEVINLSALRFKIFNRRNNSVQKSVAPSCIIEFSSESPTNERFAYISPKQAEDLTEEFCIIVEPSDFKTLSSDEAAYDPDIWSALVWGDRRDWALIKKLGTYDTLSSLKRAGRLRFTEGIIRGKNPERQKEHEWLIGRRILESDSFPEGSKIYISANELPKNSNPLAERPRKEKLFNVPQLIIKQSWSVETKRFQARMVIPDEMGRGVVCSQSYLSVCAPPEHQTVLEAAFVSYNSILSVYFLLLSSGRFAAYRPEALAREIHRVPLPKLGPINFQNAQSIDWIDKEIREAFQINEAEWILVEDLCGVTLEDFRLPEGSPGKQKTQRKQIPLPEPELRRYCECFIRVLKAGFGQDKQITATIFQEHDSELLPYRLVAFELDRSATENVQVKTLYAEDLLKELETLNRTWLSTVDKKTGSIYYQRIARIYDHRTEAPTIFILKPDAYRYWTRNVALHDADEVAADFASWQLAVSV